MTSIDAQKSEVHATTADAESSSTAVEDAATTLAASQRAKLATPHPVREPEPLTDGTTIVADLTDDGGPLVIKSDDPALNPPRVPQDPFPTDRTPEIDLPVRKL